MSAPVDVAALIERSAAADKVVAAMGRALDDLGGDNADRIRKFAPGWIESWIEALTGGAK